MNTNNSQDLLQTLQQQQITLRLEGERLLYDAPKGALSPALLQQIREHKTELIQLLRAQATQPRYALPSFPQLRFWTYQQNDLSDTFHNLSYSLRLHGKIDCIALEKSLYAIIQRHELLRTVLQKIDNKLQQVIYSTGVLDMQIIELQPVDSSMQNLEKLIKAELDIPFDLANTVPLRVRLFILADDEAILFFCIHHIIFDDWSSHLLLQEIVNFYQHFHSNKPITLPKLTAQYADYAQWQQQQLIQPELLALTIQYWQHWLANSLPTLKLPVIANYSASDYQTHIYSYELSPQLTQQLKKLCQQTETTLFTLIIATLGALFQRYSDDDAVVFAVPMAMRQQQQFEPLFGRIGGMLALRIDVKKSDSFLELIQTTKQSMLHTLEHQSVPFEQISYHLSPTERPKKPLFQVLVSFLLMSLQQQVTLPDLQIQSIEHAETHMRLAMGLVAWEEKTPTGNYLKWSWQYRTALFEPAVIAQLHEDFLQLLMDLMRNPQKKLSDLSSFQSRSL
ncbi:condensation domain-containing protein [Beggiatoa leptomitoformis]|uniref:Condensation domain-containing protein n=1 Tax=Beggiatoa leptomitoformis TaxID=288004 RepID=A0A2N9YBJ4_9GAMM|nr:condensation domain-containing protein [Beggiatoa leptomitoformis]ALG66852.1 hypothetical protein AL038_02890 [Beggiatoa leptomitoformis]AUI67794.1 hypothetical protein BLE401_03160 [Beggiatoa leptomitoformis]